MKPIYTEVNHELYGKTIKAEYENGRTLSIPCDPANSDYQTYLRWLENPDADEAQSL